MRRENAVLMAFKMTCKRMPGPGLRFFYYNSLVRCRVVKIILGKGTQHTIFDGDQIPMSDEGISFRGKSLLAMALLISYAKNG